MEDEPVLREALARRDSALAEARRMEEFVRMYHELRGRQKLTAPEPQSAEPMNEFMLEKTRPNGRAPLAIS